MGTSLTGLTPATTYDALIKVGDNGPLSATAKVLSDGLGNDSPLAMSTSLVGIGTTTPVSKLQVTDSSGVVGTFTSSSFFGSIDLENTGGTVPAKWNVQSVSGAQVGGSAGASFGIYSYGASAYRLFINSSGNVGIGTTSPVARLDAVSAEAGTYTTSTQQVVARLYNSPSDLGSGVNSAFLSLQTTTDGGNANPTARIGVVAESYGSNNGAFVVTTREAAGNIEKMRVTSDGYLRLATGGIQFNGDTAAANALDDYEEGTWTMGIIFGGASVGVTYAANTGTYTKIGRQVTVNGYLVLSNKGSSTGTAKISGLPFTIFNNGQNLAAASLWLNNVSFLNQYSGIGQIGNTNIEFYETTSLGAISVLTDADFANNSEVIVSMTYFV